MYSSDSSFFGDGPSNFGLDCYEEFERNGVKRLKSIEFSRMMDLICSLSGVTMSDKAFKKAVELAKVFKVPFKKINKKSNAAKVLLLYYQYRTMRIINYTRRHTSQ